jgi:hypothetical protein
VNIRLHVVEVSADRRQDLDDSIKGGMASTGIDYHDTITVPAQTSDQSLVFKRVARHGADRAISTGPISARRRASRASGLDRSPWFS